MSKKKNSHRADSESAHPSSSIMVQVYPVSHQEEQKPQQSNCWCISFKGFSCKLMFYTFQLGSLVCTISVS